MIAKVVFNKESHVSTPDAIQTSLPSNPKIALIFLLDDDLFLKGFSWNYWSLALLKFQNHSYKYEAILLIHYLSKIVNA